ncbi:MAG: hypothetical protein ACXWW6_06045 [Candidatus Limnocylindrales bacterium]
MNPAGLALVIAGVVLFAVGYGRARGPWGRYQALRAQDQNAERYRAWRGGPASASAARPGASVAMALLRRQARTWAAVAIVGVVLVFAGFVLATR